MKRKFTKLLAAFGLLALFILPTAGWGQTRTNAYELDFSNNHGIETNNHTSYTDVWTFQNSNASADTWSMSNCANNSYNNSWTYVRFGGKGGSTNTSTSTIISYAQSTFPINYSIDKVTVNITSTDGNYTLNSIKLQVSSTNSFSGTLIDEVTVSSVSGSSVVFEPTSGDYWESGAYFKIVIDGTAKGKSNVGIRIPSIEFNEYVSGGGTQTVATPSISGETPFNRCNYYLCYCRCSHSL